MTEKYKFNRPYRRFAEAAQEVATDKNRRKRSGFANPEYVEKVGRSPDILRKTGSKEFQDQVSPEALVSFLEALGGSKNADARHVLNIGNFLHDHRTELEKKDKPPNQPLSPEDRRLMDLACVLIEDSFYRGDFLKLSREQSASLAFTVNVVAKIFQQPKSCAGLKGFDTEKLHQFIDAVHNFEHQSLFPSAIASAFLEQRNNLKEKSFHSVSSSVAMSAQKNSDPGRADDLFASGERRAIQSTQGQYVLPYIFKYVLAVRDRIEFCTREENSAQIEEGLVTGFLPSDWKKTEKEGLIEHFMLPQDEEISANPRSPLKKYAALHLISMDIPFIVWVLRYFRSLKKNAE